MAENTDPAPQPGNLPEWTVSDISRAIRGTLENSFGRVRVRGELGRVTRPRSGHLYMDLKDQDAVLSTIAWRGTASGLSFRPEEGLEVIMTGKITAYSGHSRYQLIVDRMELAGTGAMLQAIEQLRRRLEAEGLFDPGRKRPRPVLPRIIGVITSPSGAVIRDILHRLRDRFPRHVLIWPAAVQGAACPREVVAAIEGFNACTPDGPVPRPDLLILARGGGSVEDLAGFSDESVVRAIAASEIPVISAIGHETDTTLADHAADQRAPTPTAAAELAVPVRVDLHTRLAALGDRCLRVCTGRLEKGQMNLDAKAATLPSATAVLGSASQRLDIAATALGPALYTPIRHATDRLQSRTAILPASAVFLEEHARRCVHAKLALEPALRQHIHHAGNRLKSSSATLPASAVFLEEHAQRCVHAKLALEPALRQHIHHAGNRLKSSSATLPASAVFLEEHARRYVHAKLALDPTLRRHIDHANGRFNSSAATLPPLEPIWKNADRRLRTADQGFCLHAKLVCDKFRDRVQNCGRLLESVSHQATLKRGFAVVREDSRVLSRAAQIRPGMDIEIEFADGRNRAKATAE